MAFAYHNLWAAYFPAFNIALIVGYPIQGNLARGMRGVASEEMTQAKVIMQSVEERIGSEARNALQSYKSALAKLNAARESRRAAEAVYASELRKFHQGASTTFLVLQRQVTARPGTRIRAAGADLAQSIDRRAAARGWQHPDRQRSRSAYAWLQDADALTDGRFAISHASGNRRGHRGRTRGAAGCAHVGAARRAAGSRGSADRDPLRPPASAADGRAGLSRAGGRAERSGDRRRHAEPLRRTLAGKCRRNGTAAESKLGALRVERPNRPLSRRPGQVKLRPSLAGGTVVELLRTAAGESVLRRAGRARKVSYHAGARL